jgi:RNA polymerase sigma-70 factor (ECF subfamily)
MPQVAARTETLSDESLLAGMGAGDRNACAAFLGRFERAVYGLALTMLRDRALAEDITQETFSRAWRHAQTHDPRRGAVSAWLLSITRNLAIDALRLHRPDPIDPHELAMRTELSTEAEPGEAVVQAHDRQRVRAAVAQLPTDQRRALVLSLFGGCTAREISRLDQIPLGTAKTRIRAGLQKVRVLLDEAGLGD